MNYFIEDKYLLAKVMFFLAQNKCRNSDNNIYIHINLFMRD